MSSAEHDELITIAFEKVYGYVDKGYRATARRMREQMGNKLIAAEVDELPEGDALDALDRLLQAEASRKDTTDWQNLPRTRLDNRLAVWQGDITTLRIGAVVNAANTRGLGCFQPTHMCIDNVLHRAGGPRLRVACYKELQQRAADWHGELPTGEAILTPGFNLPADYVVHTPGPVGELPDLLATSYRNVLEQCRKNRVRSVAFCCISTGLFGYPNDRAAELAVKTVREWLDEAAQSPEIAPPEDGKPPPPTPLPPFDLVVFNVFLDKDKHIYEHLLG